MNQLLENEAAAIWKPTLVRRLRGARASRERRVTRFGVLIQPRASALHLVPRTSDLSQRTSQPNGEGTPPVHQQPSAASRLTDREEQILTLAGATYRYQGARETDARKLLDLTPTAFYQQVNELIDREAAIAWKPMLVNRLRAQRGSRRRGLIRLGADI